MIRQLIPNGSSLYSNRLFLHPVLYRNFQQFFPKGVLFLAAMLLWIGCATTPSAPSARESDYFTTVESGFHILAREGVIRYVVKLEPQPALEATVFPRIRYENPADPENPHVEEIRAEPDQEYLHLTSPPLRSLEAGHFYQIEIDVFKDEERTDLHDTHEVFILSTIDTKSHGR